MKALALGLLFLLGGCGVATAFDGQASYYTVKSAQREGTSGVYTASGEPFVEDRMTCALPARVGHRKWGKTYMVYGVESGQTAVVRYNDQGPGKGPQAKGVVIDLSPAAFGVVCGDLKQGKCDVSVQEVL